MRTITLSRFHARLVICEEKIFSYVIRIYFEQCALLLIFGGGLIVRDLVFQFPLCSDLNFSMISFSALSNVESMAFLYLFGMTWRYLRFRLSFVMQTRLWYWYHSGLQKSIVLIMSGQIFKGLLLPPLVYLLKSVYLNASIAYWL